MSHVIYRMPLDRPFELNTSFDSASPEAVANPNESATLHSCCLSAALEIITALHKEGADFLLTSEDLTDIIYRNVVQEDSRSAHNAHLGQ